MALRIALGHQARVGKDTFADYVGRDRQIHRLSFAKKLYEVVSSIQHILNKDQVKDPALLQHEGMGLRAHYGEDIWVEQLEREYNEIVGADPNANIIITDLRLPNEMEWAKNHGFITIKITRNNRIIDRDPNHISETGLKNAKFDITVENHGTLDEYHLAISKIITQLKLE